MINGFRHLRWFNKILEQNGKSWGSKLHDLGHHKFAGMMGRKRKTCCRRRPRDRTQKQRVLQPLAETCYKADARPLMRPRELNVRPLTAPLLMPVR